jgi:hypothetical protein
MREETAYALPAFSVGSAAVLGLPGILVGLGILSSAIEGTCPSQEHLISGYIFGSLNLAAGAFILGFYLDHYERMDVDWVVIVGIGQILIGGSGIGFTIWASSHPEKSEQKLSLAPMIIPDTSGRPAVGIGLSLLNW